MDKSFQKSAIVFYGKNESALSIETFDNGQGVEETRISYKTGGKTALHAPMDQLSIDEIRSLRQIFG